MLKPIAEEAEKSGLKRELEEKLLKDQEEARKLFESDISIFQMINLVK